MRKLEHRLVFRLVARFTDIFYYMLEMFVFTVCYPNLLQIQVQNLVLLHRFQVTTKSNMYVCA